MLDRLTANLQFHGQALALRAERQQVLASNIANADTPNYQARELDFAQALRSATAGSANAGSGSSPSAQASASTSVSTDRRGTGSPGHLPLQVSDSALAGRAAGTVTTSSSRSADLLWRVPDQASIDGNTVDLDRERASFADNSMRYEATLRFINGNVRNVLSAIRGE